MANKGGPKSSPRRPARSAATLPRQAKRATTARKAVAGIHGRKTKRSRHRHSAQVIAKAGGVTVTEIAELQALRAELEKAAASTGSPLRWNADPDDVQRSVAHLVLTLVEFIRRLLERQAIRRMEGGSLTETQIEEVGTALMKLEETVRDIAARFGIQPEELNLDLGPVGKLM